MFPSVPELWTQRYGRWRTGELYLLPINFSSFIKVYLSRRGGRVVKVYFAYNKFYIFKVYNLISFDKCIHPWIEIMSIAITLPNFLLSLSPTSDLCHLIPKQSQTWFLKYIYIYIPALLIYNMGNCSKRGKCGSAPTRKNQDPRPWIGSPVGNQACIVPRLLWDLLLLKKTPSPWGKQMFTEYLYLPKIWARPSRSGT